MRFLFGFGSALMALAVAGCGETDRKTAPVSSQPRATAAKTCEGNQAPMTECNAGGKRCSITVSMGASGTPTVAPWELNIPANFPQDITIVWKLADPSKYEFTVDDGAKDLTKESSLGDVAEFSGGSPSDNDDGSTKTNNGKNYRMDFKNDKQSARYHYAIQFREKESKGDGKKDGKKVGPPVHKCDPYINNQNN
jgi:hypothetical protein